MRGGKKMLRAQASFELVAVVVVCAAALLLSAAIFSDQLSTFKAYGDQMDAQSSALRLFMALNDAKTLGNGSAVNATIPAGYNATVSNSVVTFAVGNASGDCQLRGDYAVNATYIPTGDIALHNNGGVIAIVQ